MYERRKLGKAELEYFKGLNSIISFSDFCAPANTIEFNAYKGFLRNSIRIFRLTYPGYDIEAGVHDGRVYIRRNSHSVESQQYLGEDECHVAIQWGSTLIGCGVVPPSCHESGMDRQIRICQTGATSPPSKLVTELRRNDLLENELYKSGIDAVSALIDCIHLAEKDIRRYGSERDAWVVADKGQNKPKREPEISRFVATILGSLGAGRNIDITCEPIAGSGNIDFYAVAPVEGEGLARIAIEAKKADSSDLVHGLELQLPEYMDRIGTEYGVYLVYWLKCEDHLLIAAQN